MRSLQFLNFGGLPSPRLTWLCRATAVFGLALVSATWRLWTPQIAFPQVPLLSIAVEAPHWIDWTGAGVMVTHASAAMPSTTSGGGSVSKLLRLNRLRRQAE